MVTSIPTTMDEQYELQTHRVEEYHWWYAGRRRILRSALARVELPPAARILDAGCGSGRNMVDLAQHGTVTGLELAEASVLAARSRGVGEVVAGSMLATPFAAAAFDLIVSMDVIEHLDDDRPALAEMRRIAAPGGRLLITVPAYQWLWSTHDVINHHRRRYTRAQLVDVAASAGWTPVRTTYFNSLLLPAAVASRWSERLRRTRAAGGSDLDRTPRWLNGALRQPLHAEARFIQLGGRIPVGLSLLGLFR